MLMYLVFLLLGLFPVMLLGFDVSMIPELESSLYCICGAANVVLVKYSLFGIVDQLSTY
jgi:hypothetical protein